MGRNLKYGGKATERVSLRLPVKLNAALLDYAKKEDSPKSEIIVEALTNYLKSKSRKRSVAATNPFG